MNTNVRIVFDDDQRRRFKEVFGKSATRNNIKFETALMVFKALGEEKPRTMTMKTVNLSEKAKEKIRAEWKKKKNGR